MFFLISILFISFLIFIIFFLLLTLGFVCLIFLILLVRGLSCLFEFFLFLAKSLCCYKLLLKLLLLCPIDCVRLFSLSFVSRYFLIFLFDFIADPLIFSSILFSLYVIIFFSCLSFCGWFLVSYCCAWKNGVFDFCPLALVETCFIA